MNTVIDRRRKKVKTRTRKCHSCRAEVKIDKTICPHCGNKMD